MEEEREGLGDQWGARQEVSIREHYLAGAHPNTHKARGGLLFQIPQSRLLQLQTKAQAQKLTLHVLLGTGKRFPCILSLLKSTRMERSQQSII